jgi:glucose/mannose transport system substrate-binding protein
MKKGLAILDGSTLVFPSNEQMIDRDSINQINDLLNEFFADPAITAADAQSRFADIIEAAPK